MCPPLLRALCLHGRVDERTLHTHTLHGVGMHQDAPTPPCLCVSLKKIPPSRGIRSAHTGATRVAPRHMLAGPGAPPGTLGYGTYHCAAGVLVALPCGTGAVGTAAVESQPGGHTTCCTSPLGRRLPHGQVSLTGDLTPPLASHRDWVGQVPPPTGLAAGQHSTCIHPTEGRLVAAGSSRCSCRDGGKPRPTGQPS
jgi:hypothetical protein